MSFAAERQVGAKLQVGDSCVLAVPLMGDGKGGSGDGVSYATLVSSGKQKDTLLAVATDAAEMHETREHIGMIVMHTVKQIEVPAAVR